MPPSITPRAWCINGRNRGHCLRTAALAAFVGWTLAALAPATQAGEIKVLTAGAFKPVLVSAAVEFEKQSGHQVVIANDTAGALLKRIHAGEAFDLVVLTPGALAPLAKDGKIASDSVQQLARVAIGVAVKRGAPLPDISTVNAFRNSLLAARAVAYIDPAAGGSSGIYLAQWFAKAGIADRINRTAVLVPGGLVAARLLDDQADLAIHQISEILAVPGAQLVGPIPEEIQNYTVYAGAISSSARAPDAARALLAALASNKTRETLASKGMAPP